MWRMIFFLLVALAGAWFAKPSLPLKKTSPLLQAPSDKEFALTEYKSFVVILYSYNQADWCERALRSVFEQDYDHYRVIVIDDGSIDHTEAKAKKFIVDMNQDEKVILIRNENRLGPLVSFYRAVDNCLDKEIVIPLQAKDWFVSPLALKKLNQAYQNPEVWLTLSQAIEYPSYAIREEGQTSYYAALFKQLRLKDLFAKGHFATHSEAYLTPLKQMSSGRIRTLKEPIIFWNSAIQTKEGHLPVETVQYVPLSSFPKSTPLTRADWVIFSTDRPLQLYSCLESIQRYVTHLNRLTVLYTVSDPSLLAGYEKIKEAFPLVRFIHYAEGDFKNQLQKVVFHSPSEYILFGQDEVILQDYIDLKLCMEQMEKTGAYGFFLQSSQPISQPLLEGVYAWDMQGGKKDWADHSLEMTLFKKEEIKKILSDSKYKNLNSLQLAWKKALPQKALGLCFGQ
jgi:glycosyltransferase involved in cell wall biosynthesis